MGVPLIYPAIFSFLGFIFVILTWYSYMTIPFEFEFAPDNCLRFRAIGRKLIVSIYDIREIDARAWNRGFVTFRLSRGVIYLFLAMPGLKNLIEEVKSNNQSVQVKVSL